MQAIIRKSRDMEPMTPKKVIAVVNIESVQEAWGRMFRCNPDVFRAELAKDGIVVVN